MVSATPNVPPNWRTAWAAAPPTPARPGGSACATTLESWGKTKRDTEAAEHHRREEVAQVVDVRAEHRQAEQAAAGEQDAAGDEDSGRCPILPASLPAWGATRPTTTGPGGDPEAGLQH